MYFPYVRGKQFDLLALRSINPNLYPKVRPIVEPVSFNNPALSGYRGLAKQSVPFILVVNPTSGRSPITRGEIEGTLINGLLAGYTNYSLGFIISPRTTATELDNFLQSYPGKAKNIIHTHSILSPSHINNTLQNANDVICNIFMDGKVSSGYIGSIASNYGKVIVHDGFAKCDRNADYPTNSFFTDKHKAYQTDGFIGFGDFTILPGRYEEGGHAAHAVALHVTYNDTNHSNDIFVRHLVSDDVDDADNPAGKFRQALNKLHVFVSANQHITTQHIGEFIQLHRSGHYPGLGKAKQIAMGHHIELMAKMV